MSAGKGPSDGIATYGSFAALFLSGVFACGPKLTAPTREPRTAHASVAAPDASEDCVVQGDGDPQAFRSFEVFAAASGGEPIAVVASPTEVPLRFTAFPRAGESTRAAVDLADNGLVKLTGWVELHERRFQLGARVDLGSRQVFAQAGTIVTVRGRAPGGLELEIPTPFREPARMTAVVPCRAAAYRARSFALGAARHAELPALQSRSDTLELLAAPEGASLLKVGVTPPSPTFSLLEHRGAYAHVLVGDVPGESAGTVIVDAWVRADQLELATPSQDRDSHGSILDRVDRCPNAAHLARDTPLRLSPSGPAIGIAVAGAELEALGVADAGAVDRAIAFADGRITAPRGAKFFVRAADVTGCKEAAPSDDGCPCEE